MASDELERSGLCVPALSPEIQEELKQFPPFVGSMFTNPVDSEDISHPEDLLRALQVLGNIPEIDSLLFHSGFHPFTRWTKGPGRLTVSAPLLTAVIDSLRRARQLIGKPIFLVLSQPTNITEMKEFVQAQEACVQANFPVFHTFEGVAQAMVICLNWHRRPV